MPLILFKTNLKSLKYGNDRPGGGDSGQPYVQFPIETPSTPNVIQNYYRTNRTGYDFPIRGGAISQLITGNLAAISATIDRERIQEFFKDAPRGKIFIEKQVGLQLTNPRTQVPNSLNFAGLSLGNAALPVTQVYNPLNTLAQVQVQGTGLHFNRHGVAPTIYESEKETYEYLAGAPQYNKPGTNRLLVLQALKLTGTQEFVGGRATTLDAGIDPQVVERYGISLIQNQLFNYSGGPGSTYGIGFTRIFRATNTEPVGDEVADIVYSNIALTYAKIANQDTRGNGSIAHPRLQDFRYEVNEGSPNPQLAPSDYSYYNIERRLNTGNPGAYGERLAYNETGSVRAQQGIDRLNALSPFYFNPNSDTPWTAGAAQSTGVDPTKDIIKFAFECLSNDNQDESAAQSAALIFRAFLDGAISDSNTAAYNTFKYLGRGETFRTYQGFDRSISFSFKVFVQSRTEMVPLYAKLNQLISQVYPDYSDTYSLMRGSVVRLTIGDYIYRMPGFLENVNITIDNSNTSWEILLNEFSDNDVRQLPHLISVNCSFKPIMDILPRRQTYLNRIVPLIVNRTAKINVANPTDNLSTATDFEQQQQRDLNSDVVAPPTINLPSTAQTAKAEKTQTLSVKSITPAQKAALLAAAKRDGIPVITTKRN